MVAKITKLVKPAKPAKLQETESRDKSEVAKSKVDSDAMALLRELCAGIAGRIGDDKDFKIFLKWLNSPKATSRDSAFVLCSMYARFRFSEDLELNALFQEAFMLCGQTAIEYKTYHKFLKEISALPTVEAKKARVDDGN